LQFLGLYDTIVIRPSSSSSSCWTSNIKVHSLYGTSLFGTSLPLHCVLPIPGTQCWTLWQQLIYCQLLNLSQRPTCSIRHLGLHAVKTDNRAPSASEYKTI